jgi:hypothetical protein
MVMRAILIVKQTQVHHGDSKALEPAGLRGG